MVNCWRKSAHCNTLQHTATHCNTLQHTGLIPRRLFESLTCYLAHITLQHTATHCNTLQHTATHGINPQKTDRFSDVPPRTHNAATHCTTLQHTATHCNTLDSIQVMHWVVNCWKKSGAQENGNADEVGGRGEDEMSNWNEHVVDLLLSEFVCFFLGEGKRGGMHAHLWCGICVHDCVCVCMCVCKRVCFP